MTSATLEIKNSYILEELSIRVGKSGWQCLVNEEKLTIDNKNAEFLENNYMQSQEFVNKLNSFELEGENLSKWILGESGYPELEVTMTENTK